MKDSLHSIWRWIKWPLIVLVVAYVVLVIYRAFVLTAEEHTAEAVAAIHATKLTLADVEGKNLPPMPDQAENDATVAGVDKNNNGIRDDVELAIFKKYPSDKKARAAALQYALTEQMYLTRVVDTPTWKAVAEEDGRAGYCVALSYSRDNKDFFTVVQARVKYVEDLVFNTESRRESRTRAFEFITSHGDAPGESCDVNL